MAGAAASPARSRRCARAVKPLYAAAGAVSTALGVLGAFLPLLPTTPFLLLASWCFLRGSPAAHRWMHSHRHLGPYLSAYEEGRGIPRRAKLATLALMWLSMTSAILYVDIPWARIAMATVAVGVTLYLVRLPTLVSDTN
ncbi:MAG TPA: YbaN family protein [Usitatibacter sp.]|nr:YbaN family protein [Usitatibacter sp.]